MVNVLSGFVFTAEDLRNSRTKDVQGASLKFCSDLSLDIAAIMSHVMHSETCMPVARLMELIDISDVLLVQVCCECILHFNDTTKHLSCVYDDVVQIRLLLLS